MENIYVKLGWPEYQTYQKYDEFDEHAHYCSDDDLYFVEKDWLEECNAISIDYNGTEIKLFSYYVGKDRPQWEKNEEPIHHHKITIKIGDKRHSFDFWSGLAHYRLTTIMTGQAMIEAFDCFLVDCCYADQTIDEFQKELCYDNVSDCIRTYNACRNEFEAWKAFGIDHNELENWLRENYDL